MSGTKRPPANRPSEERRSNGTFAAGTSGNPSGRPKAIRALLDLARHEVPASFELARELRDDEKQEPRVRLEAAKFLCAYGLGAPPKLDPTRAEDREPDDDELSLAELRKLAATNPEQIRGKAALDLLSQGELRNLARQSLADERDDDVDDDDEEESHQ